MSTENVVGLLNLILSLFTLAIVLRFWWRHREAGFARAWWIMAFAFGLFAVSETFALVVLLGGRAGDVSFSLTIRVLFMAVLIGGLYQVFEGVLRAQDKALNEAQNIIELQTGTVMRAQETEVLARLSERFATSLDLEVVLAELCQRARELSGADSAWVRLPDELKHGARFMADFGSALQIPPETIDPFIEQISLRVAQAARPAVVEDTQAHPQFGPESPAWAAAFASYPLRRGPDVIGTLTVTFARPHRLSDETQRLLAALADTASIAVRNAQLHERIEIYARTDALTGLANRRNFNETLTSEVRRARRYKLPLALIMADVDGLKGVNDQHGHIAGDALLCAVAEALRNSVRLTDLAARFGGDEFAVILPGTSVDAARQIAARIQSEATRLAFDWNGAIIPVSVALGVSGGEAGNVADAAALLSAADDDLYRTRGRSRAEGG